MHEMGIATSVLDAARREAERHPGSRVLKVGVRIGEWSGVDPESLRFCFEAIVVGCEGAPALDIESGPARTAALVVAPYLLLRTIRSTVQAAAPFRPWQ